MTGDAALPWQPRAFRGSSQPFSAMAQPQPAAFDVISHEWSVEEAPQRGPNRQKVMPGDWECAGLHINFAKRKTCWQCAAVKHPSDRLVLAKKTAFHPWELVPYRVLRPEKAAAQPAEPPPPRKRPADHCEPVSKRRAACEACTKCGERNEAAVNLVDDLLESVGGLSRRVDELRRGRLRDRFGQRCSGRCGEELDATKGFVEMTFVRPGAAEERTIAVCKRCASIDFQRGLDRLDEPVEKPS